MSQQTTQLRCAASSAAPAAGPYAVSGTHAMNLALRAAECFSGHLLQNFRSTSGSERATLERFR